MDECYDKLNVDEKKGNEIVLHQLSYRHSIFSKNIILLIIHLQIRK